MKNRETEKAERSVRLLPSGRLWANWGVWAVFENIQNISWGGGATELDPLNVKGKKYLKFSSNLLHHCLLLSLSWWQSEREADRKAWIFPPPTKPCALQLPSRYWKEAVLTLQGQLSYQCLGLQGPHTPKSLLCPQHPSPFLQVGHAPISLPQEKTKILNPLITLQVLIFLFKELSLSLLFPNLTFYFGPFQLGPRSIILRELLLVTFPNQAVVFLFKLQVFQSGFPLLVPPLLTQGLVLTSSMKSRNLGHPIVSCIFKIIYMLKTLQFLSPTWPLSRSADYLSIFCSQVGLAS